MRSVILVDDHPAIRLAIKATLESSGRFVVADECDDGQQAWELFLARPVDLMVIDLEMPNMNGLELVQKIRETHTEVKLLMLAETEEVHYIVRAIKLGANGYVGKSKELEVIVAAADALLDGCDYFPSGALQVALKIRNTTLLSGHASQAMSVLTERELEVLQLLVSGLSNKAISEQLFVSNKTISAHKINILDKFNLNSLTELIHFAHKNSLV